MRMPISARCPIGSVAVSVAGIRDDVLACSCAVSVLVGSAITSRPAAGIVVPFCFVGLQSGISFGRAQIGCRVGRAAHIDYVVACNDYPNSCVARAFSGLLAMRRRSRSCRRISPIDGRRIKRCCSSLSSRPTSTCRQWLLRWWHYSQLSHVTPPQPRPTMASIGRPCVTGNLHACVGCDGDIT
jgi:hypothetical protein